MKISICCAAALALASASLAQSPSPAPPAPAAPAADAPPPGPPPWSEAEAGGERGLRVREPGVQPGWTLVAPINSTSIHLIDLDGNVVHTWETANTPGASTALLPNGHLLRAGQEPDNPRFHGGGIGGRIQEIDWDGKVVWDWTLFGADMTQHHEVLPLPNGNVLVIAWVYHSRDEAIAQGRDPEEVGGEGLWSDALLEVRPQSPSGGEIVWEWHTWDHLVQDRDVHLPNYGRPADAPGRIDINADHRFEPKDVPESDEARATREAQEQQLRALGYVGGAEPPPPADPQAKQLSADWLHTNGVSYEPALDLIVMSTPHLSELWIIDHSTTTAEAGSESGGRRGHGGALLWRWGNPRNYGAGGAEDQRLFGQHNPTWLPGPAPRLLVFDNGGERPGEDYSEVLELAPPFDDAHGFAREAGRPFGPAQPAWSYADRGTFFSGFISGAQRLPNGDTLICSGAPGRVFEVTPAGHVVWDWRNTLGGEVEPSEQGGKAPPKALFRAWRVPADDAVVADKLAH